MHELGILRQIVKVVDRVADENKIEIIKYITLEIGKDSDIVPYYMQKLFPVAADAYTILDHTELRISMVAGRGLVIKDIGY